MRQRTQISFLCFIILLGLSLSTLTVNAAVSGKIAGQVTDANTGESLPGANVMIIGTSLGTATDPEGRYFLPRVPPGQYTLKISYIGYQEIELPVTVYADQTLTQNGQLSFQVVEGESIFITAQAEGQMEAINQQLSSTSIKNIVASDRIQEIPDANAAESVGRLPGVSILRSNGEGNKVVVRGLSPQYNSVTVNGVRMASSGNDRSVDMSMISSNLLSGIEVQKSLTPDRDADAIGGIVDFKLKEAPNGFNTDLLLQGGYNGQQSETDNYKMAASFSNRFWNDKFGVIVQANTERFNRSSDNLSGSYRIEKEDLETNTADILLSSITLTDHLESRKRTGASLFLDYKLPQGKVAFHNFYSLMDREITDYKETLNINEVQHNYQPTQSNRKTTTLTNALSMESVLFGSKIDASLAHSFASSKIPWQHSWTFQEPGGFASGFDPEAILPVDVQAFAKNDSVAAFLNNMSRVNSFTEEREYTAQANIEMPFALTDNISGAFKFGGKYRYKTREHDINERTVLFRVEEALRAEVYGAYPFIGDNVVGEKVPIWLLQDRNYDPGEFLGGNYDLGYTADLDIMEHITELGRSYEKNDATESLQDDYSGNEALGAGYAMAEINLGSKLLFIPGVRYERIRTEYQAWKASDNTDPGNPEDTDAVDTTTVRINSHFFPMFQLRYKVTDWFDVRLARTKSLTRPSYRDIMPKQFLDTRDNKFFFNNPQLEPSISVNYDLYLSFYGNRIGLFTVGGFYKEIDGLIWQRQWSLLRNSSDTEAFLAENGLSNTIVGYEVTTDINNRFKASFKGVEFDWQTNFWYLPNLFRNLVLNINYTHIFSETTYPRVLLRTQYLNEAPWVLEENLTADRDGQMLHQPNNVVNISLGYDISGFSARLSMLYQGEILSRLGARPEVDGFTEDYVRWDLSVKQNLPFSGLQLYLNLNNISDRPDISRRPIETFVTSEQYYGRTGEIGIRYVIK